MNKEKGKTICFVDDSLGKIEVIDFATTRSLYLDSDSKQSSMFLWDPFALATEYNQHMMMPLLFQSEPKNCLFLGLGGGSMPKFIWKHFPHCQLEVVEHSEKIIQLCFEYFSLPKSERMRVHACDALEFLQAEEKTFDLIFVDLFSKEGMAPVIFEKDFFPSLKKTLGPNGVISMNIWGSSEQIILEELVSNAIKSFKEGPKIIPSSKTLNVTLLFQEEEAVHVSVKELEQRARFLEKQSKLHFTEILQHYFRCQKLQMEL